MLDYRRLTTNKICSTKRLWFVEGSTTAPWQAPTVDNSFMQRDFAKEMHALPAGRRQLIFQIRRQIAEGTYETEEKLDLAFDRLMESFADDEACERLD